MAAPGTSTRRRWLVSEYDYERGEWVQIRGYQNGGPVQEVDEGSSTVTFLDVRLGKLLTVPRVMLCQASDRTLTPTPVRYEVSALRRSNPNRRHHTMYLEVRPGDRWVVTDGSEPKRFHAVDGTVGSKYDEDARSDEWKARFWLSFSAAAELASKVAEEMAADLPERFRNARTPGASDD